MWSLNESEYKWFMSHDKMAAMPIYAKKTSKIFFSGTYRSMNLKLSMQHPVLEYYQVCSNDVPGLTLTYFTTLSNLVPCAFVWEKVIAMDFSESYCGLWYTCKIW